MERIADIVFIVSFVVFFSMCKSPPDNYNVVEDVPEVVDTVKRTTTQYYVDFIDDLPDIKHSNPSLMSKKRKSAGSPKLVKEGNVFKKNIEETWENKVALSEYLMFNQGSDAIWPGALVSSMSVREGGPALININREPITIWIDVGSENSQNNVIANAPSVNSAMNTLVKEATEFKKKVIYDYVEVYEKEASLLELGISAKWMGGSVTAGLTNGSTSEQRSYFVKFYQPYFTMSYKVPDGGNEHIFSSGLPVSSMNKKINKDDQPLYVSSVTYGRMMFFQMETSLSANEMNAYLNARQKLLKGEAAIDISALETKFLENTSISYVAGGGGSGSILKPIKSKDYQDYIQNEYEINSMEDVVPIAYTINELKKNRLVAMDEAKNFRMYNENVVPVNVHVALKELECHKDGDGDSDGDYQWRLYIQNGENKKSLHNMNKDRDLTNGTIFKFNQKANTASFKLGGNSRTIVSLRGTMFENDSTSPDDKLPAITKSINHIALPVSGAKQLREHFIKGDGGELTLRWYEWITIGE